MKIYNLPFYGIIYRNLMRFAHKKGWHYAPPSFPLHDIQLWCQWCGLRQTYDGKHYKYNPKTGLPELRIDVVAKEIKLATLKFKEIKKL